MRIVFDVGGSVLCPEGVPDTGYVKRLVKFLVSLKREKHKIIIVTGGGRAVKNYINSARAFKPPEELLDYMGILGTRINALFMISALGTHAYRKIVKNREGLEHGIDSGKIVVMGGTVPGQTTDAVSMAAATLLGADLILIMTDVKGIYNKDPDKYKNVKMIKKVTPKELHKMLKVKKHRAGLLTVIDPVAVEMIEKVKIKTIVLNGENLENVKKAIEGKKFVGTLIG